LRPFAFRCVLTCPRNLPRNLNDLPRQICLQRLPRGLHIALCNLLILPKNPVVLVPCDCHCGFDIDASAHEVCGDAAPCAVEYVALATGNEARLFECRFPGSAEVFNWLALPREDVFTSGDSQGMKALVVEVRQLRKDLQATNGYAVKAQILLYRLQVQEATVARVAQHLNDLRSKLDETQRHRRDVAATLKHFEELTDNSEISPASRKEFQQEISGRKSQLENLAVEEQQRQSAEIEAAEQLRAEQAKLSGLEDRVDRLEKDLGSNPR